MRSEYDIIRHVPLGTCCVSRSVESSIHSLSSTSFQVELGAPGGGGSSSPFLWSFLRGGGPEIFHGNCIGPSPLQASKNPTFSAICCILRPCSPTLAPRCPNIARDSQENSILEPKSSNRPPKTLPRQPPGPSGGGPNPQNSSKSAVVLIVFTLRPFFPRSRKKS